MLILEIFSSISKVVMFLTTVFLFATFIKKKDKNGILKNFWYLSILSIIDSVIYIIFITSQNNLSVYNEISKWWQLFYILFEFFIISSFLININDLKYATRIRYLIILISILIFCISILNNWDFKEKYYTLITIIELVFINTFSIRYLLFYTPDLPDSRSKSISILVKGMFLFINVSSPYYIIIQFIDKAPYATASSLSFINDIAYTILFISIYISIKCIEKK